MLDGGLATELERRGMQLDDQLWSARLLLDAPEAIRRLHLDYLEAGADCIATATYQATFEGFAAAGLAESETRELLQRSVELARQARDEFWRKRRRAGSRRLRPLVAASVGPYGALLADGSEYRGDYGLGEGELLRFHRARWEALAQCGADLMACETIPSAPEARALARLCRESRGCSVWISFTCRDDAHISDGTDLTAIVRELTGTPGLVAIGVNCTAPERVSALLGRLRAAADLPLVVYPNSGETWDGGRRCWLPAGRSFDLAAAAPRWRHLGARLIGGCCRTGPDDIRKLRAALLPSGA